MFFWFCSTNISRRRRYGKSVPNPFSKTQLMPEGFRTSLMTPWSAAEERRHKKRDQGKIMSDNAKSKATRNKPALRSIRIEFSRPSAFAVAIIEADNSPEISRHSSDATPAPLGSRLCQRSAAASGQPLR
jgi:hypothetical protein